jgi:serine/threonine protein kinase
MPEPISHPVTGDSPTTLGDKFDTAPSVVPPTTAERYVLGEEMARGGMGVIYRATDTALGRAIAVKVLQAQYAPTSAIARRFAAEARITAQLQLPAIPPVHDFGSLPDGRRGPAANRSDSPGVPPHTTPRSPAITSTAVAKVG